MEFVKNFTPTDFQAKNFTPSISPNFNSFSDKNTKKWVKMEKFTPLAKILHCRRHWRHWQISTLGWHQNFHTLTTVFYCLTFEKAYIVYCIYCICCSNSHKTHLASWIAVAAPMPLLAPVTRATFPRSDIFSNAENRIGQSILLFWYQTKLTALYVWVVVYVCWRCTNKEFPINSLWSENVPWTSNTERSHAFLLIYIGNRNLLMEQ